MLFLTLPSETISKLPIKKLWKKIRVSLGAFGCASDKRAIITVQGKEFSEAHNVRVDAAARIKAPCAAPSKLRNTLPPLASNDLIAFLIVNANLDWRPIPLP